MLLWMIACGPAPEGLVFPVDTDANAEALLPITAEDGPFFWPWGVKGGGHPEGHRGWDLDGAEGVEILAVGDGVVKKALHCDDAGGTCSFGHFIRIALFGSGGLAGYHHVGVPLVDAGDTVTAGQPIAVFTLYDRVPVLHFDIEHKLDKPCLEPFFSDGGLAQAEWYRSHSTPNPDQEDAAYIDADGHYSELCFDE